MATLLLKFMIKSTLPLFYGTKFGTSEGFAFALARQLRAKNFNAEPVDLQNFQSQQLKSGKAGIFLVSSTGDGDPTDNAIRFIEYLKTKPDLSGFKFSVFGLGNSCYEHFNGMGKQTLRLLKQSGAQQFFEYGEGDDDKDINEDFANWKLQIGDAVKGLGIIQEAVGCFKQSQIPFVLQSGAKPFPYHNKFQDEQILKQPIQLAVKNNLKAHWAQLTFIKQLKKDKTFGSTLHAAFKVPQGLSFVPAGNLLVFPKNSDEQVQKVIKMFGLDRKSSIKASLKQGMKCKLPFPSPIIAEDLIKHFLDLSGQLSKQALERLSKIKEIKLEKYSNIVSVLQANKIMVTFQQFIGLCQAIKPRYYTIAGCNPNQVQLILKVQQYGLFSSNLANEKPNSFYKIAFEDSSFKHFQTYEDIFMIATGTGLAPFKAFIQLNQKNRNNKLKLLFGCKNSHSDFILKQYLTQMKQQGVLSDLHLALSRQGVKQYVQDKVPELRQVIKQTLQNKGAVMVCGSIAMGKSVQQQLQKIFSGEQFFEKAVKQGRIIKELFG